MEEFNSTLDRQRFKLCSEAQSLHLIGPIKISDLSVCLDSFAPLSLKVTSVALSVRHVLSGSKDGTAKLWAKLSGELLHSFTLPDE
eukprot:4732720-Amphidinium_carterae.1